jgi:hypothetical protein
LCATAAQSHHARHVLKPVSELPTHAAFEPEKQFCRAHSNKELEYYCKTDSQFVCATCTSESHTTPPHDIVPLADLLAEAQAALATACAKVEAVRAALDSAATTLIPAKLQEHRECGERLFAELETTRMKVSVVLGLKGSRGIAY